MALTSNRPAMPNMSYSPSGSRKSSSSMVYARQDPEVGAGGGYLTGEARLSSSSSSQHHSGQNLNTNKELPAQPASPTVVSPTIDWADGQFVQALHDFVPVAGSNTCLSFRAGEIIKVLNRDPSGWHDGEVNGKRGWFPSNYVEPLHFPRRGSVSDEEHGGLPSELVAIGSARYQTHPVLSSDPLRASSSSIVDSIAHAVLLLRNAVEANRVSHFQPSTACVISSIRSILSATDCLTRESVILKTHVALARERKQILSVLAGLVTQARKASDPALTADTRYPETRVMLQMADNVLNNVRRFLAVAQQCGVELPTRYATRIGVSEDGHDVDRASMAESLSRSSFERRGLMRPEIAKARSLGDLRNRRKMSGASMATTNSSNGSTSPLLQTSTLSPATTPDSYSPVYSTSPWRTTDSVSSAASSSEPGQPGDSGNKTARGVNEVLGILSTVHDQLLSTIAAFIGHVHAHSRASHPSSYAQLIDMTRETIERVRALLVVVEAVSNHPWIQASESPDLQTLVSSREALYVATTALVTAARVATSAPASDASEGEDEEKKQLLQSTTGVWRAGGDCVGAVKTCVVSVVGPSDEFEVVLQDLRTATSSASVEDSAVPFPADSKMGSDEENVTSNRLRSGNKGQHTLSMLGRKATSLSCLKDKYERDGAAASPDFAAVDEEEEWASPEPGGKEGEWGGEPGQEEEEPVEALQDGTISGSRSDPSRSTTSSTVTSLARNDDPVIPERTSSSRSSSRTKNHYEGQGVIQDRSRASSFTAESSKSSLLDVTGADGSPRSSVSVTDGDRSLSQSFVLVNAMEEKMEWLSSSDAGNAAERVARRSQSESRATATAEGSGEGQGISDLTPANAGESTVDLTDKKSWLLDRDYDPKEISFNADGNVTGGTLRCLIERMTLHDSTIDATFSNTFFLTFRMFTTPAELTEFLVARFDIQPPPDTPLTEAETKTWHDNKAVPVRLRIYNFFKTWLENHWHPETDSVVLDQLIVFTRERMALTMPGAAQRLIDLLQKRAMTSPKPGPKRVLARSLSSDRLKGGKVAEIGGWNSSMMGVNAGGPLPTPLISKTLLSTLRSLNQSSVQLTDFDPLELARQFTIMESRLYCAITPDELLNQEFSKKASNAVHVKAMSALSTRITGWIAEIILNEQDARKRTNLLKYFIKVADRCMGLNNYNTLMAVLAALNSSTISRLRKTWDGLSNKYKLLLEGLRKATEHSRNYAVYRSNLRNAIPPCLPFLGLYLTDLTFCHEGNPVLRTSPLDAEVRLINFDRYHKIAKIIGDLQRFQVAYNLMEVPEIQAYLTKSLASVQNGGDVGELYRRSLLVEPRQPSGEALSYGERTLKDSFWKI